MSPSRAPRGPGMEISLGAEIRRGERVFTSEAPTLSARGLKVACEAGLATGEAVRVSLFLLIDGVEDDTRAPVEVQGVVSSVAAGAKRRQAGVEIQFERVSKFQEAGIAKLLRVLGQA